MLRGNVNSAHVTCDGETHEDLASQSYSSSDVRFSPNICSCSSRGSCAVGTGRGRGGGEGARKLDGLCDCRFGLVFRKRFGVRFSFSTFGSFSRLTLFLRVGTSSVEAAKAARDSVRRAVKSCRN